MDGIVKYKTDKGEVALSPQTVRDYLVQGQGRVTDQEVMMFLEVCRYQRLNPFLREAYLIKYGDRQPATIVVGKDVFTKRAQSNPLYAGAEAGVTVVTVNGELVRREGTLVLPGENLVGGWARVYVKGYAVPIYAEASMKEYCRYKADGTPQRSWAEMPATMIRKVALVQALREAFPSDFQGLYAPEEMPVDAATLPTEHVKAPAPQPEKREGEPLEPDAIEQPRADEPQDEVARLEEMAEHVETVLDAELAEAEQPSLLEQEAAYQEALKHRITSGSYKGLTIGEIMQTEAGRRWLFEACNYLEEQQSRTPKQEKTYRALLAWVEGYKG